VDVLKTMGHAEADWCLPEVRGLTREAGIAMLDRAAEVGLLTRVGDRCYTIHPAVPWFFKSLFDAYYALPAPDTPEDRSNSDDPQAGRPMRAFVRAMGELGSYFHNQYGEGNLGVIALLYAEEANLLHARQLARQNGWWKPVISTMQGLVILYDHTGRRAEWKGLVDEIVPDFVEPATDGPRPGREDQWNFVTDYRVKLARVLRDWAEAERLQRVCVERNRRAAENVLSRQTGRMQPPKITDETESQDFEGLTLPPNVPPPFRDRLVAALPSLSENDRHIIRNLAHSLHEQGEIQRERGELACIASYELSLDLFEQIGGWAGAAICAMNLGTACCDLPGIRNLEQVEHWYRRSLELLDERDRLNRGKCQCHLGSVALERLREARNAGEPKDAFVAHLNAALAAYLEALKLIPEDAVNDRAVTHSQLGVVWLDAGDIDHALSHYREAIRFREQSGDTYGAAKTRIKVAASLAVSGRFVDARDYAVSALNGFATFGASAADEVQKTQGLIKQIDDDITRKKG
jgi:tetratricopeptide (TPR) repeat protein